MPRNIFTGDEKLSILYVAPSQIILDPKFLARERPIDDAAVASMVVSMKRFGQLQPIKAISAVGEDGKKHLFAIFGATRTRAGMEIEATNPSFRLHVHVIKGINEEDAFAMAVEENRQRNKTTPIDDGINARRLMGYGWTKDRVAELYGNISIQAVDNLLSLLSLPTPIRDRVRDGTLPAAAALEHLVGVPDAEALAIVTAAEAAALEANPTVFAISDAVPPWEGPLPEPAQTPEPTPAPAAKAPKAGKTKPPKTAKVGKSGQPKVTGRQVAEAARGRGHQTKRSWSDIRAVIEPRGDMVSRSIMDFFSGGIDGPELDRVLDEAAAAMNAMDAVPGKAKTTAKARQPIRELAKN